MDFENLNEDLAGRGDSDNEQPQVGPSIEPERKRRIPRMAAVKELIDEPMGL